MREVELWTADDHFVAVVEIAPFPDRGMPEVVRWGDRVFIQVVTPSLPDGEFTWEDGTKVGT